MPAYKCYRRQRRLQISWLTQQRSEQPVQITGFIRRLAPRGFFVGDI